MERQYEDKTRRLLKELKVKECQGEFQELRKYLQNNKELQGKGMKKSPSYARKIISEYSTNDH
jgi:hypothetical protein